MKEDKNELKVQLFGINDDIELLLLLRSTKKNKFFAKLLEWEGKKMLQE